MINEEPSTPTVTARFIEQRVMEVLPGELGPEPQVIVEVELSNGRTVLIDDWGVIDERDIDPALPIPEQRFFYLSWDELLTALDAQRQAGQN